MNNADAEVIIKCSMDTKNFDSDIKNINNRLEELRKKAEEPYEVDGVTITGGWNLSEEEQREYDELAGKLQEIEAQQLGLREIQKQITKEVKEQNNSVQQQNNAIQEVNKAEDERKAKIYVLSTELEEMVRNYKAMQKQDIISAQDVKDAEELKQNIIKTKKEIEKLSKSKLEIRGITDTGKGIEEIGKAMSRNIKKVGKWALAVFGIRTAYNAIRGAMSTISSQDEQLATDIDYMKNALAYSLEPIVRGIVNLIKQLMTYVAYLIKAWTGKNIFENANKSLQNTNKQAKQLSKTLAGFDEMDILSDTSGATGGGTATPSFDLTSPEDIQPPSWLVFIKDNGTEIAGIILGIVTALKLLELGFGGIKSLGIGLILAGVVIAIKGILDFIKEPSWQNFLTILEGISLVVAGIAVLMGGWVVAIVAVGVAIVTAVIKNWDRVKSILGKVGSWIYDYVIAPVGKFFSGLWDGIIKGFKGFINIIISGINLLIKGLNLLSFDIPSWIPIIGGKKWGFNAPEIPKLAKGGIISRPGPGVAIGGEGGMGSREGVIPLTDSQQMALLGEAIGRYITINANITNTMNGRVISRELQKIQNSSDFAYNS